MLGQIRRQLIAVARQLYRDDLVTLLVRPASERHRLASGVGQPIEALVDVLAHAPHIGDDIDDRWLPARAVAAFRERGLNTVAKTILRFRGADCRHV